MNSCGTSGVSQVGNGILSATTASVAPCRLPNESPSTTPCSAESSATHASSHSTQPITTAEPLHLEHCPNARIAARRIDDTPWLIRSAAPDKLTAASESQLRNLNVTTIVDLREPGEGHPRQFAGITTVKTPIYCLPNGAPRTGTLDGIYTFMLEQRGLQLACAVAAIADAPGAALVHCSIGKDRTGLVVALARLAAGDPQDAIITDYARSASGLNDQIRQQTFAEVACDAPCDPQRTATLHMRLDSPASMMIAICDWLDAHGGAAHYLEDHGLTSEQLNRLRSKHQATAGITPHTLTVPVEQSPAHATPATRATTAVQQSASAQSAISATHATAATAVTTTLVAESAEPSPSTQYTSHNPHDLQRLTIVHLSDIHAELPPQRLFGRVNPLRALEFVPYYLRALAVHPDVIVVSGDLIHRDIRAYQPVAEALQQLAENVKAPLCAVPGNHDDTDEATAALSVCANITCAPNVITVNGYDIYLLDSSEGRLSDNTLSTLRERLHCEPIKSRGNARPAILVMHHSPVPSLMPGLRQVNLRNADDLAAAIDGANVRLILAGHFHHAMQATFTGVPVSVAPSMAYEQRVDAGAGFVEGRSGAAFTIEELSADGCLRVTTVPISLNDDVLFSVPAGTSTHPSHHLHRSAA